MTLLWQVRCEQYAVPSRGEDINSHLCHILYVPATLTDEALVHGCSGTWVLK